MIRPRWAWRFEGGRGEELAEPVSPAFANRYDAEQWLGETWRSLAAEGVASARVLHDGDPVGPVVPLVMP